MFGPEGGPGRIGGVDLGLGDPGQAQEGHHVVLGDVPVLDQHPVASEGTQHAQHPKLDDAVVAGRDAVEQLVQFRRQVAALGEDDVRRRAVAQGPKQGGPRQEAVPVGVGDEQGRGDRWHGVPWVKVGFGLREVNLQPSLC